MKKALFGVFFISFFVLASSSLKAEPEAGQGGIIINLAGKQRMLTQKMVKEALLIFAGIDIEKNRKYLGQTVGLFVKTLEGLRNGDDSLGLPPAEIPSMKSQIDLVKSGFDEVEFIFRRIIKGEAPSSDAIAELAEKNTAILEDMNTVVEMYEQELREVIVKEKAFLGVEINLSGKQRMLSQKMAKEALLIYLDIDRRKNKRLLHETCTLFDKSLNGMKYGDGELGLPGTTEKNIAQQLDFVVGVWKKLKPIMERSCDIMVDKISKEEITTIANLNLVLLNRMDKIVTMYENLARQG